MTREEAIAFFKDMNECTYGNLEAVEMAIKALKQEPTTKNDLGVDCIVDVLGSYTDLDIPYKREIAENILTKLFSVTPRGMTIKDRNNKLKHFITCLKCEISGKCCDDNCSTQYDAGNMGEIIKNLEAISKALEQEPILDKIYADIQKLRGCSCSCSDGIIDDVEDILDKYKGRK